MPFKSGERVREITVTQGAGTYTCGGSPTGYQPVSAIGANNYGPFTITDGTSWECIIGQYLAGPDRLARTHVIASSNGGVAVVWGAGTRVIRNGWPAWLSLPKRNVINTAGGVGTTVLTQLEQRAWILEFTGALTGNRTIEVDTTEWDWIVYNNTSGAFTLTVKVTGQTGVVVPQGRRAFLYCDATDVRPGVSSMPSGSEFASGTAMVFNQTTAPTGWTKGATHNDKALRVVTGTVGSGGNTAFTSVFGASKTTGAKTLATAEIPSHSHTSGFNTGAGNCAGGAAVGFPTSTDATGGGGSHDHTLSLDLQYVDVIVATKD